VPGVADNQLETPLEDGVDRVPGDAGALHPNVRCSRFPPPVPQRFEARAMGAKRRRLHVLFRPGAPPRRHSTTVSLCTFPTIQRLLAAVHPNRALKKRPRLISRVKDMHYFLRDARSSARAFTSISLKSLKPMSRLQAAMDSTAT
jgi:hypothetical protein